MKLTLILLLTLLVFTGSVQAQKTEPAKVVPYAYPLKAIPGQRYLADSRSKPFFWSGDAAWSLIAQLSSSDADLYLENRKDKGFTVIMVSLIEHKFSTNPPANFYGELPFTGKAFISSNEKYFAHADSVIESANRNNIIVLMAPLYLGYGCGDEGWCAEVKNAAVSDLYSWGRYVGERYRKYNNIIWLIGGDTDPSPVREKVLAMVKGIREKDTIHLFSAHNQPETMAVTAWPAEQWLTVNNVYSYDSAVYVRYRNAYAYKPVMPFFQIESAYENEHKSTPQELRSYAYWAILSGAMGHVFGNCPVWHFGAATKWCNTNDWKEELNNSGSVSMDFLQRLFRSRSWQTLVPDFDNRIIISGYGIWETKDHVSCVLTSDENTMIAYLPSKRSIEVDMSKINGSKARCWWYNPSDGRATEIGIFSTSGKKTFTPGFVGDWVLVVDNVSANLPAPGSEVMRSK
jgi:hypothetical protein